MRPFVITGGMGVALLLLCIPYFALAQSSAEQSNIFERWIGYFLLKIASFVMWVGGMLLELSIDKLILKINLLLSNEQPLGLMITKLWALIRDMCNLLFIFGFVWVGIRTIIDSDDSGAKRTLASLIIAALLINFSLFITKAIIDVSNYTAVEIYNATFAGPENSSLSASFAKTLGILDFYSQTPSGDKLANFTLTFYFMAAVLLVVAGFVFAAGGLLIITRFVVLVFIMIFSPLLFAATVFPQTEGIAKKLWSQLISSSFFAPAYLILLLISAKVISAVVEVMSKKGTKLTDGISGPGAESFSVIVAFIIGIMILLASLRVAQQFGMVGAEKTMGFAHSMRRRTQGFTGRNTIGRFGNLVNEKIEEGKRSTSGRSRAVAGVLSKVGVGAAGSAAAKATYGGTGSYADGKKAAKEHGKEHANEHAEIEKIVKFKTDIENGQKANATPQQKIEMERAIAKASVKQLEELSQDQRLKLVEHMTQSQLDGLDKSTELTVDEKSKIHVARKENLKKIYAQNRDDLAKASIDNLNALGANYLQEEQHAIRLNSSQMDELKKKLTPTEFTRLNDARTTALTTIAAGGTIDGKNKDFILRQKAGEQAKMPANALKALSEDLSVNVLAKIVQDGTLTMQDQAEIKRKILNSPNTTQQLTDAVDFFDNSPLGKQFGK